MSVQVPSSTSPPPRQGASPMTYSLRHESTPFVRQLPDPLFQSTDRVLCSAPVQASGMDYHRQGQSQSPAGQDNVRGTHEETPHIPRQYCPPGLHQGLLHLVHLWRLTALSEQKPIGLPAGSSRSTHRPIH